jgi:hypothetical protein
MRLESSLMFPWIYLLSAAMGPGAQAADVLVPTFTPKTMGDFAPAERLTADTMAALSAEGIDLVSPAEIQRRAGEIADGCAERTDCTETLWRHFPGSGLAVVGSVTYSEGMLDTRVMFYSPDEASPLEIVTRRIPEARSAAFAAEVAATARDLLELVPDRDAGMLTIAAAPTGGGGAVADAGPSADSSSLDDLDDTPPSTAAPTVDDDERRTRGLPPALWERYKASGKSYRDWKDDALVRAGCLLIEVHAGAVFGDVERVYDTRVAFDQIDDGSGEAIFEEIGGYQYDAFVRGSAFSAGGSLGFVPLWWLEISVYGGAEIGRRKLTTGWEQYYTADPSYGGDIVEESSQEFGPVPSTMAVLQPRLRLYTLPSGPVKPYGLVGVQMRFYDAFDDSQLNGVVQYPTREGGVGLGVSAGGGIAFDAPRGAIGFIEVPWTKLVSPVPYQDEWGTVYNVPKRKLPSNQTLAVRAGIDFRLL